MMSEEDDRVSRPSRYRSLRKPAASSPGPANARRGAGTVHSPDRQPEDVAANSISRSMSRYRRRAASAGGEVNHATGRTVSSNTANPPPVPAIPIQLKSPTAIDSEGQTGRVLKSSARNQTVQMDTRLDTAAQSSGDRNRNGPGNMKSIGNGDRSGTANPNATHQSPGEGSSSWEVERDRLLAEQKRRDLRRLEEELENSQKAKAQAQAQKLKSPVEKMVLMAKGGRSTKDDMSPISPMTPLPPSDQKNANEPTRSLPARHEPDGRGIAPQIDAPTSAINAGDRSVKIHCYRQTLVLPVTPDTTIVDIITQASRKNISRIEFTLKNCVVVEQYAVLGLERRIRPHESIRDVMNSWDNDTENYLKIALRDQSHSDDDFEMDQTPTGDVPHGYQAYMYHSNRPGKWNKRWVTLLESGQVVSAKKRDAKTSDKDTASLCHLSDYDIYSLKEAQVRRIVNPPARFCFAIKSQHKTSFFLNTENYVQYFSTDDPVVAREFRKNAHNWRGKYLLDLSPEGRTGQTGSGANTHDKTVNRPNPEKSTPEKTDNVISMNGHRLRVSVDETPYALGQFEPLLDLGRFDKRLSQFGEDFLPPDPNSRSKTVTGQITSRRLSLRRAPDHSSSQAIKQVKDDGFTGGLLGEAYDDRKQALANQDKQKPTQDEAFTQGPSLLNIQREIVLPVEAPDSSSWFPSAQEHTAKHRTSPKTAPTSPVITAQVANDRHPSLSTTTQRPTRFNSLTTRPSASRPHAQPHTHQFSPQSNSHEFDQRVFQKPLVDLTPKFQEPPQWSKDKKGHGVKPPDNYGHLVDFIGASAANGNDTFSNGPPIRRPTTSGTTSLGRTRSMSTASTPGRPLVANVPPVPSIPAGRTYDGNSGGRRMTGGANTRSGTDAERLAAFRQSEKEQAAAVARRRAREREQRNCEYREREAAYNAVPGRKGTLRVV